KDCFKDGTVRGTCDAARFPITEYKLELNGPKPWAAHVVSVVGATAERPAAKPFTQGDVAGVQLAGLHDAVVAWRTSGSGALHYTAPAGPRTTHVILDAPEQNGMATITAKPDGAGCAIDIVAGGTMPARPAIVTLDAQCNVAADPEAPTSSGL